jgi:hypothetical protein
LFWIYIHYNGPGEGKVVAEFDKWNYDNTQELAQLKKGQVSDEGGFIRAAGKKARFFLFAFKDLVQPSGNRIHCRLY